MVMQGLKMNRFFSIEEERVRNVAKFVQHIELSSSQCYFCVSTLLNKRGQKTWELCTMVVDIASASPRIYWLFFAYFSTCAVPFSAFSADGWPAIWRVHASIPATEYVESVSSKQQFPCNCEQYPWHPTLHLTRIHLRIHQTKGLFRVRLWRMFPFGGSFHFLSPSRQVIFIQNDLCLGSQPFIFTTGILGGPIPKHVYIPNETLVGGLDPTHPQLCLVMDLPRSNPLRSKLRPGPSVVFCCILSLRGWRSSRNAQGDEDGMLQRLVPGKSIDWLYRNDWWNWYRKGDVLKKQHEPWNTREGVVRKGANYGS